MWIPDHIQHLCQVQLFALLVRTGLGQTVNASSEAIVPNNTIIFDNGGHALRIAGQDNILNMGSLYLDSNYTFEFWFQPDYKNELASHRSYALVSANLDTDTNGEKVSVAYLAIHEGQLVIEGYNNDYGINISLGDGETHIAAVFEPGPDCINDKLRYYNQAIWEFAFSFIVELMNIEGSLNSDIDEVEPKRKMYFTQAHVYINGTLAETVLIEEAMVFEWPCYADAFMSQTKFKHANEHLTRWGNYYLGGKQSDNVESAYISLAKGRFENVRIFNVSRTAKEIQESFRTDVLYWDDTVELGLKVYPSDEEIYTFLANTTDPDFVDNPKVKAYVDKYNLSSAYEEIQMVRNGTSGDSQVKYILESHSGSLFVDAPALNASQRKKSCVMRNYLFNDLAMELHTRQAFKDAALGEYSAYNPDTLTVAYSSFDVRGRSIQRKATEGTLKRMANIYNVSRLNQNIPDYFIITSKHNTSVTIGSLRLNDMEVAPFPAVVSGADFVQIDAITYWAPIVRTEKSDYTSPEILRFLDQFSGEFDYIFHFAISYEDVFRILPCNGTFEACTALAHQDEGIGNYMVTEYSEESMELSIAITDVAVPAIASAKGIKLDGISQYLEIYQDVSSQSNFTIEFWISPVSTGPQVLLSLYAGIPNSDTEINIEIGYQFGTLILFYGTEVYAWEGSKLDDDVILAVLTERCPDIGLLSTCSGNVTRALLINQLKAASNRVIWGGTHAFSFVFEIQDDLSMKVTGYSDGSYMFDHIFPNPLLNDIQVRRKRRRVRRQATAESQATDYVPEDIVDLRTPSDSSYYQVPDTQPQDDEEYPPIIIGQSWAYNQKGEKVANFLYEGYVDDVKIWNRVLSHEEIVNSNVERETAFSPGLVSYISFDDDSDTSIQADGEDLVFRVVSNPYANGHNILATPKSARAHNGNMGANVSVQGISSVSPLVAVTVPRGSIEQICFDLLYIPDGSDVNITVLTIPKVGLLFLESSTAQPESLTTAIAPGHVLLGLDQCLYYKAPASFNVTQFTFSVQPTTGKVRWDEAIYRITTLNDAPSLIAAKAKDCKSDVVKDWDAEDCIFLQFNGPVQQVSLTNTSDIYNYLNFSCDLGSSKMFGMWHGSQTLQLSFTEIDSSVPVPIYDVPCTVTAQGMHMSTTHQEMSNTSAPLSGHWGVVNPVPWAASLAMGLFTSVIIWATFGFLIHYRHRRQFRQDGIVSHILVLLGLQMMAFFMFLWGDFGGSASHVLLKCQLQIWLLFGSWHLILVTLFLRNLRLHVIFNGDLHRRLRTRQIITKGLSGWRLVGYLTLSFLPLAIILLGFTLTDGVVVDSNSLCVITEGGFYVFLCLLIMAGVAALSVIAFKTRTIPPEFGETRELFVCTLSLGGALVFSVVTESVFSIGDQWSKFMAFFALYLWIAVSLMGLLLWRKYLKFWRKSDANDDDVTETDYISDDVNNVKFLTRKWAQIHQELMRLEERLEEARRAAGREADQENKTVADDDLHEAWYTFIGFVARVRRFYRQVIGKRMRKRISVDLSSQPMDDVAYNTDATFIADPVNAAHGKSSITIAGTVSAADKDDGRKDKLDDKGISPVPQMGIASENDSLESPVSPQSGTRTARSPSQPLRHVTHDHELHQLSQRLFQHLNAVPILPPHGHSRQNSSARLAAPYLGASSADDIHINRHRDTSVSPRRNEQAKVSSQSLILDTWSTRNL